MLRAERGYSNNAAVWITCDPAELQELLADGRAQCAGDMRAAFRPVETAFGEVTAGISESGRIDLPLSQEPFSGYSDVVVAIVFCR